MQTNAFPIVTVALGVVMVLVILAAVVRGSRTREGGSRADTDGYPDGSLDR